MYTTRPCTTTCVIDGAPVTFTYYPDTCVLRVSDAAGRCLREDRWEASWAQLLTTLREIAMESAAAAKPAPRGADLAGGFPVGGAQFAAA
ncbi:hypothetical protein [Paraburkholderia acidisoli]|uniref:Uncharacterized protein n=1 Tax=Paraburkholderia acidisoli TaxID=2571748 RepID=A0A7Z2JI72_9BURK|nr:hypothetical protein [Paraburkholderia acidisoli]QGZ64898.1 hypothetical protein FAZ98_24130 [Paraburkholderia acidisoli]